MPRIRLEPTGRTVEVAEGETILDVLNRIGTPVDSVCGGRGKCGRCQVKVLSDPPLPTDDDVAHISLALLRAGMRLACRLTAADGLVIEAPEHSHVAKAAILEACEARADISPAVVVRKIAVPLPTLESPTSRMERFVASIEKELGLRPRLPLKVLEDLSRIGDPKNPIGVVLRGDEVLHLSTSTRTPIYGVAVDVGTTTVVAYLVDLTSGQTIAVRSQLNPQVRFGDDVISRITYARANPDGIRNLQRLIIGSIDGLIAGCCDAAGISREDVYEVMLVGNTSMHHSVFGFDQTSLAFAPFAPIETVGLNYKASELGLTIAREGYAVALPNVAGFVGADHISMLLATQLDKLGVPAIAIDIGTNGEVSVSNGDQIACASVAAGPAFEGANLSCGMRGMEGAIDHVSIRPDLQPAISTIGDAPARGVCGSGIIDLVAELVKAGIVDRTGKLVKASDPERVKKHNGDLVYSLTSPRDAEEVGVHISQNDIVQISFAKAAMHAAVEILMERVGIVDEDVSQVLLAGAFGNYASPASAMTIGLFPEVPLERVKGVGNAAGAGATMSLLDSRLRQQAEELAKKVEYVELAAMPEFEDKFHSSLYFPHLDESKYPKAMATIRRRLA